MALPATDLFGAGADAALPAYSVNWSTVQGAFQVIAAAGAARGNVADVVCLARWNADAFDANQYSQVIREGISAGDYHGPAVRLQSGAATGYHVDTDGSDNYLIRTVAGVDAPALASGAGFVMTLAAGDVCRLEVTTPDASTVRLVVKKALAASPTTFSTILTFDDTDPARITAAGSAGIFGYGDTHTTPAGITAWQAGNLSGGGSVQDLAGGAVGQAGATGAAAISKPIGGGTAGQGAAGGGVQVGKPLGGAATDQASASGALTSGATLTTPPLKNNTGTLLADEAGAIVHVYSLAGALVLTKNPIGSNGAGVMSFNDPALVAGTTYRLVIVLASGAEGMDKVVAA